MKYETAVIAFAGLASARDVSIYGRMAKREVPQEHSHEPILIATNDALQLNNPLAIQDTVFGLLGNKAAAEGAPNVDNLDCLQQIIADQAFTNAKAAGDVNGQAMAIMFRALERNTGSVGLASVLCNETAVNPEIAAITQHQDPASPEASGNKAIEIAVAQELAALGLDPTLALQTGTFAPGKLGDPTAKGNTCDVAGDPLGCIISQNLLTPAASEAEIKAAVANVKVGSAASAAGASAEASAPAAASATAVAAASGEASADAATGTNVQSFTGTLGGAAPPVISSASDRPFSVNGATFVNIGAALQRSCDVQNNACFNAANSGQLAGGTAQCQAQKQACDAASPAKRRVKNRVRALDFGSCGNPAIQFGPGLDGRKEDSFAPVDSASFNHGSALNIKVISDFTCQRLASSCDAAADVVATCNAASTAAQAQKGQAAADAFNSALGVSA